MLKKTPRIVLVATLLAAVLAPSMASAQAVPVTSQGLPISTRKLSAPVALVFRPTINPNPLDTLATASMNATLATAHQSARESTLLGIYYLRSSQRNILAGNDAIYNDVFGSYYDRNNDFFKQGIYVIDNTHFFQVHNTYASIRTQLDNPVVFNGGAQLNPASLTTADGATTSVFGNTYGWRHWGFTNTGDAGVSPPGVSPGTQLRWMDDNATALGNRFYNEKLDIYGLPGVPSQQHVGNVFFTEMERPSDRYGLGTTPQAGTMAKTELNRTQMLIASFSEFRTGFTNPNIPVGPPVVITLGGAFYGLRAMERFGQPNGSPNFYDAYDAENFGRFVKRLAEIGLDDVRKLPPLNKNAQFRPIVLVPAAGS